MILWHVVFPLKHTRKLSHFLEHHDLARVDITGLSTFSLDYKQSIITSFLYTILVHNNQLWSESLSWPVKKPVIRVWILLFVNWKLVCNKKKEFPWIRIYMIYNIDQWEFLLKQFNNDWRSFECCWQHNIVYKISCWSFHSKDRLLGETQSSKGE